MTMEITTEGENIIVRQSLSNIVIPVAELDRFISRLEDAQHDIRLAMLQRMKDGRQRLREAGLDGTDSTGG